MLDINAKPFLGVATELRSIQMAIVGNVGDQSVSVVGNDVDVVRGHLERLKEALEAVGANLALKSLERLSDAFAENPPAVSYLALATCLADIESRFVDHLEEIVMFVVPDGERQWLRDCDDLVGWEVTVHYPRAVFEFEEAAKCIGLGRHTASVFHAMRVLEIGIRALAARLQISDPISGAARNWNAILRTIAEENDKKWPKLGRTPDSEGDRIEKLHVSLDAVRNPWRNATMHVETIYAPHEAEHIFNCVKFFMQKLAELCDEDGGDVF